MRVTDKHVLFWGGVFSNFEQASFSWDVKVFPTNEHFFMYQKALFFKDYDTAKKILLAVHPRDAKKLGREVKNFDTDKWKEVCRDYMKQGLELKFRQNPDMCEQLLELGEGRKFVECSPYDLIWGIGLSEDNSYADDESKWRGTNWLGQCLDEVRLILKK